MTNKKLMEIMSHLQGDLIREIKNELHHLKKKKYYSYKEASELLCISVEGLKSRIKRGQMAKVCNNNRPLIAHSEVERFLLQQNPK